jgi:nitrogen fixation protein NifB
MDLSQHPCFEESARERFGRIHLPVAPRCNVKCNFCDRKFDCANESRPGVTSAVLTPQQALRYLQQSVAADPSLRVVGIAGPGDPFANAAETLETLRLVRAAYPELILCVASNGLAIGPHVKELAALEVSHVTITVNAVDPALAGEIYAWVRPEKRPYRGRAAGELVVERQRAAVVALKAQGIVVKVNTIVIPRVNTDHVIDVARAVSELGADIVNIIPLYPVPGTSFGALPAPSDAAIKLLRRGAGQFIPQMTHCARCRADAVGLLGKEPSVEQTDRLSQAAAAPPNGSDESRPYVAVATREGALVNQHLGQADEVLVFAAERTGFRLHDRRPTPAAGGGSQRWLELAALLSDCSAVLVSGVGERPRQTLADRGLRVLITESLIDDALEQAFSGRTPRAPVRSFSCGAACSGTGGGCG